MKKIQYILLGLLFLPLHLAQAVCPICTVAVGAGIGFSRYLGIDDTITGAWIGGLVVSMAFWTDDWIRGKGKSIRYQNILLLIAYYLIVVAPLYWKDIIGHPLNKIMGIDKIVFGIIIGSLGFYLGTVINGELKKRNDNKVYFPFQKVVTAIVPLIILSGAFYFITK